MKVLLSERGLDGHRRSYMEGLLGISGMEFFIISPENVGVDSNHFFALKNTDDYFEWTALMKKVINDNNIDVLHILDGDSIMKWFGYGFRKLKVKIIITYHHFFPGTIRRISYYCMCDRGRNIAIAHTNSVKKSLVKDGIKNVRQINYPAFNYNRFAHHNIEMCKKKYNVPLNVPTIGIVGGLSKYKNIITFLNIMEKYKGDFYILISGKENDITREQVENAVHSYEDKVNLNIRYLNDQEYEESIIASDIIYCIYGDEFDGASGPMTDGVCGEKLILACNHGSLGEIVSENCIGITADCNNELDILEKTGLALNLVRDFKYEEKAIKYKESLKPLVFQERYKKIYSE